MKVNLVDLCRGDRNWLGIMIISLMTEHCKNAEKWDETFKLEPRRPDEGVTQTVDLKVTINGVEVKFEHFVKELERQHNVMLEEAAKELLPKRSEKLLALIEEAGRLIDDEIEASFPGRKAW